MPELPEVETTRRGIVEHILGQSVQSVEIRQTMLRWPVPKTLAEQLSGKTVLGVERRGKYLLVRLNDGTLIIHLGMSGSLRIIAAHSPHEKHDHVDIFFENGIGLRFRDPRRFGCILWTEEDPLKHKLLEKLGPEPLSDRFNAGYMYDISRGKTLAIKTFLMDSHRVVGVGNIYASESLFRAQIDPRRTASSIEKPQYERLVSSIRGVLTEAIHQGGTTLKDFVNESGKPGYFQQSLAVYGRESMPCRHCETPIVMIRQGLRASYYCPNCQI